MPIGAMLGWADSAKMILTKTYPFAVLVALAIVGVAAYRPPPAVAAAEDVRETAFGTQRIAITGCTSGLGRALAKQYLEKGHYVACCGRHGAALETLRAETAASSDYLLASVADVSVEADMQRWAAEIRTFTGGSLDVLIANAGVADNTDIYGAPYRQGRPVG